MASGKQLSFAFGEVSPSLRYRVNAQFYSQAVAKLLNKFVKKSGGVSNRPGTTLFFEPSNQSNIPTKYTDVGVKLLTFKGSDGKQYLIQLAPEIAGSPLGWDFIVDGPYNPLTAAVPFLVIYDENKVPQTIVSSILYTQIQAAIKLNLKAVDISILSDSMVITFNSGFILNISYTNSPAIVFGVSSLISQPQAIGVSAANPVYGVSGTGVLDIPVCYLITQEKTNGEEVFWKSFCINGYHPHSQLSANIQVDAQVSAGVKQYNIYRSAGSSVGMAAAPPVQLYDNYRGSHYALVGRIEPGGLIKFSDFTAAPDLTVQPPLDTYLYPKSDILFFAGIRRITYYKERAVIAYSAYKGLYDTQLVDGQIGCSKLGAPLMMARPLTPGPLDAFSFTVPTDKIAKITNVLVMSRLIVFTENHTFVVRGGDNGVLTFQQVNPDVIYHEGCSEEVLPVAAGNRGFFVNRDKSKLLTISIQRDDAIQVQDISVRSDHLFETRDIRNMHISSSFENILWILKTDGTAVILSISEDSTVQGFSRYETDGFIESITPYDVEEAVYIGDKSTLKYPSAIISVIRDGVRYFEKIRIRNDIDKTKYLYADHSTIIGSLNGTSIFGLNSSAVISTTTDFLAGSTVTVTITNPNITLPTGNKVDFFYGEGQKIRLTLVTFTAPNIFEATCEEDIPLDLQNVSTTNYIAAVRYISGLMNLVNKEVAVYADGMVRSNPLNPRIGTFTVGPTGDLDLEDFYNYGYVGLPYESEMETLDLEASDSRTFTDAGKLINSVGIGLHRTSGGFVGQTGQSELEEMPEIDVSGYVKFNFPSTWESTGRVLIKQVDPLPMSILSVYPKGVIGE